MTKRARTADVRGDVAADLRLLGRSRIRRKPQPLADGGPLQPSNHQTRLDRHPPCLRDDLADGGHAPEHDHKKANVEHDPTRIAHTTATKHEQHANTSAPAHHPNDLTDKNRKN